MPVWGIAVCLLLTTALSLPERRGGEAQPGEAEAPLRLLRSDARQIELELRTEVVDFDAVESPGGRLLRPRVSGLVHTASPGEPDLPSRVILLGIPPAGRPRLEIEVEDSRRLEMSRPLAAVRTAGLDDAALEAVVDSRIGSAGGDLAADIPAPAEVLDVGWLRDQRVARIELRPLHYDAGRSELIHHRQLRLRLRFEGAEAVGSAVTDEVPVSTSVAARSGAERRGPSDFDALLDRALLNPASARAWRRDVGSGASALALPAPPAGQLLANIAVETDGLYSLRGFDLVLAGVSLQHVDARKLQLFEAGQQLAIEVEGQADGRLDLVDRIRFYGRGSDTRESKQRIYQLVQGSGFGFRVGSRAVVPGAGRSPTTSYTATRMVDFDALYLSDLPHVQRGVDPPPGPPLDRWYSARIREGQPLDLSLPGLQVAPGAGEASLRLAVVGRSNIQAVWPDHELRLRAGGQAIGQVAWDGDLRIEHFALGLPAGLLQQDPLDLRFEATGQTGAPFDHFHLDEVALDYRRRLRAEAGALHFRADPGTTAFDLDGFSSDDLRLYDLSQPRRPVLLSGWDLAGSPGDRVLRFDDGLPEATYLALESGRIRAPSAIMARQGVAPLAAPAAGADYLILAHPNFVSALQPLLAARRATMRTELVDLQRVYDAFGNGQPSAGAIRDMIAWAYHHWPGERLHYVLLVGDGSYDMLGRMPAGNPSYLPPYLDLVDPWLGEVASDNAYAAVNGEDYFPDLLLGRLPVASVGDASRVVQRILDYERASPGGSWRSQLLFAADDPDVADFHALSDAIIQDHVPPAFGSQRVYLGQTHQSLTQARAAIVAAINQGRLVTQYVGHGQSRAWAAENLLRESDLAGLVNGDRLTVMLDWTCLTGRFDEPIGQSMAEAALLAPSGGAVAYVAPTGFGVATGHDYLNRAVFDALLRDGTTQVGALLLAGKLRLFGQTGAYHDLVETYTLFGDPATPIQLPPGYQPVGPSSTPTVLPKPSATPTPPPSPTPSPSRTPTASPTASPTPTPSRTPTATRTATPTVTSTASPSRTPTASPTATSSRTATSTASPSATRTPTLRPTADPSATATATPTPTLHPTSTTTETAAVTATGTGTGTPAPTSIPTASPSVTATPTSTLTSTPTRSPTATLPPSATAAPSGTTTASPSRSPTASGTVAATATVTFAPSPTATVTREATAAASASATTGPNPTASATASPTGGSGGNPTAVAGPSPTGMATDPPTAGPSPGATPGEGPNPTVDPKDTPTAAASEEPAATPSPPLAASSTPGSAWPSATHVPGSTPPGDPSPTARPEPSATRAPGVGTPTPEIQPTLRDGGTDGTHRALLPLLIQGAEIAATDSN